MHEWALAEGVIRTALESAEAKALSAISRIAVRIGELQRIEQEVFQEALERVMPPSEPRLRGTKIELSIEPARLRCRPCGAEFGLAEIAGPVKPAELESIHFIPELAHAFMACPRCESPDFEVLEGRGVWIEAVEGR